MIPGRETRRRAIGIAFPVMVGGRILGAALSPVLFAHFPLGLLLISPFMVHLVVTAPLLDAGVYFSVAICITTIQALIGYHFGRTYGRRALNWLLERLPVSLSRAESFLNVVQRLSIPAVFALPGPVLGTIAGVARVPRRIFHVLVVPAQVIWVVATYFAGEALLEYIELARDFVIDHALGLTALTVGLVMIRGIWMKFRRRNRVEPDGSG